ncbi:MAG: transcription termination factor Rho, partial [Verrucomicrobiae bacterium]|nr:transcription termination factor Rho [Verrucomicrobiae bacterium]
MSELSTATVDTDADTDTVVAESGEAKENQEKPRVPVPDFIDLNEFQKRSLNELHAIAQEIGLRVAGVRSKHQLVFEILCYYSNRGTRIEAEGLLEYNGEAHGFLRWPDLSFMPNIDDVYLAPFLVRKHEIKSGNLVRARVRAPKDREKFLSVEEIVSIEGIQAEEWKSPVPFDNLTALFPQERLILEIPDSPSPSPRVVDLIAPLGKGQRGLIVAPPRGGKTILLKNIAVSLKKNHPEVELIVLLLDERPEEVTDFKETVDAAVFSSTFDEPSKRHVQVSDMVAERARRLVELKKDVVILLDSLTRLARGHNSAVQGGKGGGRMGSGGLDTKALQRPRKFFGAARNVEEGGSLTILATCLVETESRMDEVIF